MKNLILAVFLGGTLGIFSAVKLAGPVLAENNTDKADVYEQLDLFGDIFDRIRSEYVCLLYTSPSPRDRTRSRMPSSA